MARFSAGKLTGAGSTTLPIISLYTAAATVGTLREVGVFNTAATAVALKLVRLDTTGTQGAALVNSRHHPKKPPALCKAFTTHTGSPGPTLGDDLGYRTVLGAAIGAGVIWTFGDDGILLGPEDAAEQVIFGVGLIVENGAGQACQAYLVWDE